MLIFPISGFHGLITRHVGLFMKFSLWSVLSTQKTTLYNNNMPWRKIRSDFDVTMGSFDGVETCELVGLFLLSQLTHLDVNVGLYRDDGLATCAKSPKQVEEIKNVRNL